MFDHVEKPNLLSEVSRCPPPMPTLSAHSSWLYMALSVEDILSTPSTVNRSSLCTADPGAGTGHLWTLDEDSRNAALPDRGVSRQAWPICPSPSKSLQGAAIWAGVEELLGVGWCHLYRISPSHIPHREAAASTAPMPLKSPGLVTSMCTGYFHSMYLVQPVYCMSTIVVPSHAFESMGTHPNKRLYGQSTCPSRAQGPS